MPDQSKYKAIEDKEQRLVFTDHARKRLYTLDIVQYLNKNLELMRNDRVDDVDYVAKATELDFVRRNIGSGWVPVVLSCNSFLMCRYGADRAIEELACGLREMNDNFMWDVRESEIGKHPGNFMEETSGKSLVVSWCPQLQVLAHRSVRCFVTHCGWNSVLEALSFGVPIVTMPHWADQATNAKFVADVWKVGVRVKKNEKGITTKEEVTKCITQVMEEEKGMKMRKASLRWKELAKEAVNEGGSSDNYKNIEEFVAEVKQICYSICYILIITRY
ncbi:mogroside IE synthase-like [Argentina anserina]|uniref:mogroside IE synthase-like n=1 Tax=Argentina anserina TaxID=57926 RepID=UPI0021762EC0|nr:mogroside IE synthase-like [Potentilla anserina]